MLALPTATHAHVGRRLRLDVAGGKLTAQGVNTGAPDGAPNERPYDGVVHDHWRNFTVPALPTPEFANSFLPEFDVPPYVTELEHHSLSLQLTGAWQWVSPPHHALSPNFTPLDPGEVIRIDGAANTFTTTEAMGSLLLSESIPAGGDPDVGVLYSIDGHPQDEIHILRFIVSAENTAGPTHIQPSDPIFVVIAPDGPTHLDKLHHQSLFLSEYLSTRGIPEPTSGALMAACIAALTSLARLARR
jgi:hypothetical protein